MNLDGTKLGGSDTTFIRLRIPVPFATGRKLWLTDPLAKVQRRFCLPYMMVGGSGLEPLTSCVSSKCSNQLS